jgi:alanyl-tRNA synthetase
MTSNEIREAFLTYFDSRGHSRVISAPVVPWGDPTLLFANAGMNQFKDVFLGVEQRDYNRATTCQKCIRAGGKHNDLDEVGRTPRHGTFLEMLGNFSFGDYFKEGAITYAWELMTTEMGFSPDELIVSIYSTDEEAYDIWRKVVGIPDKRIIRFGDIENGDDENFWSMGPVGPCGPCTEIHLDRGPAYGPDDPYEAIAQDAPRILELWNLVFMQYDRDASGIMKPLPRPSIDTGMGLERVAMIRQGKENIFETDILGALVRRVEEFSGKDYNEKSGMPFRVAADHVRTLSFAIADGALPSNEGRGYVLRRILRRACRYLRQLDVHEPMVYRLVDDVVELMGDAYPELTERADYIGMVIKSEEERFLKTLDQGVDLFEQVATGVRGAGDTVIGGEDAFKLYDTFGFPVDLTRIMAEEQGMTVDMEGFETAMTGQRERAREASSFATARDDNTPWQGSAADTPVETAFVGYETDTTEAALKRFRTREDGLLELVFDKTPFYALSGGQASDSGTIEIAGMTLTVTDVYDQSQTGRVHVCGMPDDGIGPDVIKAATATLAVNATMRRDTARNHTATHLLQAALRTVLGPHVRQAGSAVDSERFRFDFNHFSAMTPEETVEVERIVNREIMADHAVDIVQTTLEDARQLGAMSLFDEKYGETVRLVTISDVSKELCGGTHVPATGRIGPFRIVSESSVAAGIRRIEGVTGMRSYGLAVDEHELVASLSQRLAVMPGEIGDRVSALAVKVKDLEKEIKRLRTQGGSAGPDAALETVEIAGVKVSYGRMEVGDANELKMAADAVRQKLGSGVGVLGTAIEGKVSIVVTVTDDLIKDRSLKAGDLVKEIAAAVGGSGGGRPHLAMAGGKDVDKLDDALAAAPGIVERFLA